MADQEIPVVGPSNPAANDFQRSINLFPRKIQREGEKTKWHLVSAPGLDLFATLDRSPIRGTLVFDGRHFSVAGPRIYETRSNATIHEWGRIDTVTGRVSMAECNGKIVIGDGAGFYSLDVEADTVTAITAAPVGRFCIPFGQRILYHERDSGRVYYSELNDPTDVPALNFFTAENRPDDLVTMIATEDKIWLLGEDTTEVWYDSGDTDNPFQRIPGSVVFNGCLSGDTAVRTDNAIHWVGKSDDGARQVFRAQGFNHIIISTRAVEAFLKTATELTAYAYQEDGHTHYVLNAAEGTWAYDISTQEWSERGWLNLATGRIERARAEIHAFCYGKHLVADYENAKLYEQSTAFYSDDGNPLVRKRVFRGPHGDGRLITIDELYIDMETGVGLDGTGQGTDPKIMLRYSVDGAGSWSNEIQGDLGAIGDRTNQVRFNRLGSGSNWGFELSVSDPVSVIIRGGVARARVGRR